MHHIPPSLPLPTTHKGGDTSPHRERAKKIELIGFKFNQPTPKHTLNPPSNFPYTSHWHAHPDTFNRTLSGRKTRETKTNQRFLFQVLHLKSFTTQLNKNHNHNISLLGLMMLHNRDRSHGFVASAESAILIQMYYILSPTISLRNCDPRCTIKLRQLIAQQYIQNPPQWFRHSPVLTTNNECPNDWQTTSSGNSMTE